MKISITPLSPHGQPLPDSFYTDLPGFFERNDGFTTEQQAKITEILSLGAGYRIGSGVAGSYLLKKVIDKSDAY